MESRAEAFHGLDAPPDLGDAFARQWHAPETAGEREQAPDEEGPTLRYEPGAPKNVHFGPVDNP